jgi:hypothetical protein
MPIKRAHHDLNGVHQLRICGWSGDIEVVARDDDGTVVTVAAPERDGETWTFQRGADGVLTCFSSLTNTKTAASSRMIIRVPADRLIELRNIRREP